MSLLRPSIIKGKDKGSSLESRLPTTHVQQTLPFPWQGGRQCSLQLLIQPWICAPGTHYGWVNQGSMEYKVCLTLLHVVSTGNQTPDLLSWVQCPIHWATLNGIQLKSTHWWLYAKVNLSMLHPHTQYPTANYYIIHIYQAIANFVVRFHTFIQFGFEAFHSSFCMSNFCFTFARIDR